MFRQDEVFPGGWPDKTVEAMRKRRFEQSIRQMEPLDANRLETLTPGALARRLEQSWQEVKRRPMYHQQLTQVWKQVLETIDAQADCLSNEEHELVERLEGGSRLACRQRVLAEKQRMLDAAIARAADAQQKLPRPEYIDLLASLAAENGQGGEALVFSAADRDTVGQAVVDAANGKKPGAGFTLAADTRETGGGVVLQRGRMEINCGCAELLRRARQEDSSAVAAVLYD